MGQIEQLRQWVNESDNIVFFGGAGVSTESGIPDFRSVDGLYNQQYDYPPETILSHTFYRRNTEEFYRFYRNKMLCLDAKPNAAHLKLAQWEREGKLKAVVTQNIDGLHQAAGSEKVYELHGSVLRNFARSAINSMTCITSPIRRASRNVPAAATSSRMLYSTKRDWIRIPSRAQSARSARRMC